MTAYIFMHYIFALCIKANMTQKEVRHGFVDGFFPLHDIFSTLVYR